MSIGIYAFLGPNIDNIDARVTQALEGVGFGVQFHPDMRLLETPSGSVLYIQVNQVPSYLKRVRPEAPLLIGFEYEVSKNEGKRRRNGWPPKGVGHYTCLISTRTASGRSRATYYLQALTLAILAKETAGYFYADVDERAVPGSEGLNQTLAELNLPSYLEFDADAVPFEGWPPAERNVPFDWPPPIKSAVVEGAVAPRKKPTRKMKLSVTGVLSALLILYFLVALLLYS
jgi:hypothetical protein